MAVVFTSNIKVDPDGAWYIILTDTVDNRTAICRDLDEYSQKVEDFGSDYGGNIDESPLKVERIDTFGNHTHTYYTECIWDSRLKLRDRV